MSSKHKHKSRRSNYPTGWSKWQWSEEHQCETRYREVAEGSWEWDYKQVPSSTSTQEQASWSQSGENAAYTVPRTGVVPSEPSTPAEEGEQSADPSEHYTTDDGTFGITQGLAGASIRSHSRDHRSSEVYQDPQRGNANQVGYGSSHAESSSGQQYFPISQASTGIYGGSTAPQSTQIQGYGYGQQYATAGVYGAGPSSYGSPPSSSFVPPTQNNTMRKIRTRNPKGTYDELDRRFKVHRSSDFQFGKVFKVLWSEPVGSGGTEITYDSRHGEKAFHKVRRFLITSAVNRGHSICIPILTYGNQGVLKPGVHPVDHAVVYSSKREGPVLLEREEGLMSKSPIRIEVTSEAHKLDPLSRLNYAKLYTVEHNVKVFFIGRVAKKYERPLIIAYNEAHPPLDPGPQVHLGSSEDLTSFAEQAEPSWPQPLMEEEGEDDPSYVDGYDHDQ